MMMNTSKIENANEPSNPIEPSLTAQWKENSPHMDDKDFTLKYLNQSRSTHKSRQSSPNAIPKVVNSIG